MPTKMSLISSIKKLLQKLLRSNLHSFRYTIFRVKIEGESLWPKLIPGKMYYASNLRQPKEGRYVVFKNPRNKNESFIKKVSRIVDDAYFVEGTVSWSSSFTISRSDIIGTLILLT